jgi:hypothetical protein
VVDHTLPVKVEEAHFSGAGAGEEGIADVVRSENTMCMDQMDDLPVTWSEPTQNRMDEIFRPAGTQGRTRESTNWSRCLGTHTKAATLRNA